jgi:hypothetical protein
MIVTFVVFHQNPTCIAILPIRATIPAHIIFLVFIILNKIWRRIQVLKLHNIQFAPTSYYLIPFGSEYSP